MTTLFSRSLLLALLSVVIMACEPAAPAPEAAIPAREVADAVDVYDVRGQLLEVRQGGKQALIAHEAIPGYMAAMTMPFAVKTPSELADLAPGDAVTFRYEVAGASSWITDIRRLTDDEAAMLRLSEPPTFSEPSNESLYFSDEMWTTQEGHSTPLAALQGRPVVLSMVFTHCSYACPMIVRDMKRIAAQMPEHAQGQVQYVLVSLDPERDTPAAMQRFAKSHGLDLNQWTLLRGEAEQVRMLAALLGVRYRQQADGQFAHTSLITVLNEHGEVVHQQKGLGADGSATAQALSDLLAAAP